MAKEEGNVNGIAALEVFDAMYGSLCESVGNVDRPFTEPELHMISSGLKAVREYLTKEEFRELIGGILPAIDWKAVVTGSSEFDWGGEPHEDTYKYFMTVILPD